MKGMSEVFRRFASKVSQVAGSAGSFMAAIFVIVLWAITGPLFEFSDTWQLVINTSTTIITFLMVFLIQNTQNRDARALHLKVDELLKAEKGARSAFVNIEEVPDSELEKMHQEFRDLHERASQIMEKRGLTISEFSDELLTSGRVAPKKKNQ